MKLILWLLTFLILFSSPAFAQCVNPAAAQGTLGYSSAKKAVSYCDGASWLSFGQVSDCTAFCGPATGTSPGPAAPNGDGYFVMTNGTWDGDLQTAAGETTGLAAANKLCLTDLTANDWLGKADAQARGLLDADHVEAFLCSRVGNCNQGLNNTKYYFARAGAPAEGGNFFTTDDSGRGPGDALSFASSGYFGVSTSYYANYVDIGDPTLWGFYQQAVGFNERSCDDFSDNTAGMFPDTRRQYVGISNATDALRWRGDGAGGTGYTGCAGFYPLICFVHPSP